MARFQKGESGNPAGRTPGTRNTATRLRQMIADDVPAILGVLRSAALEGDVQAAGLLLGRVLPAVRAGSATVEVISKGNTLSQRAEAIVASVLSGEIPGDIASSLMSTLVAQTRVLETDELLLRIERLETALNALNQGGRKP